MLLALSCLMAQAEPNQPTVPHKDTWRTWVIVSGRDFYVPPPPDRTTTNREFDQLAVARNGAKIDPSPTGHRRALVPMGRARHCRALVRRPEAQQED
jgi:hypothetical protein